MKISITGGTGLIGRALINDLLEAGHRITVISRNIEKAGRIFDDRVSYSTYDEDSLAEVISKSDAVINLAGENIGNKPWTSKRKSVLRSSRVETTKLLVKVIRSIPDKPSVFVQGSAIGYYGSDPEMTFDEQSSNGNGFLSNLTVEWENALDPLRESGLRLVTIRTGVVLSKHGGMLKRIITPFKFFIGGPLGNGRHWISWIHIQDEVSAISFLLDNNDASGIFNLTAPEPVRFNKLAQEIGNAVHRPSWLRIPKFALKPLFGERTEELLLSSQKVMPSRLIEHGYDFNYKQLKTALTNLIQK
jgi:hypothetical protein